MDAITAPPAPVNEPVYDYAPGSPERVALKEQLAALAGEQREFTAYIGGEWVEGTGPEIRVSQPHAHAETLGVIRGSLAAEGEKAVAATKDAAASWRALSFDERAAVFLRTADLITGKYRATMNAATMLGQGKSAYQAEIDSACELADFLRFNAAYARDILAMQPVTNSRGVWNRLDYRPLEGFVYAITPFNFTAIAGNLPTAPALMGNCVIWKPSPTQQLAATIFMEILIEAGLPEGVINMLPGHGKEVSDAVLTDPGLAGIHFTGSTATFQSLWRTVGENISGYASYPRLVGETGGKDFVIAHPSADPETLRTALVRGSFDYAGQKCSASSRAYIARSVWEKMGDDFVAEVDALKQGDPRDFSNYLGAVIDERSFRKQEAAIARAKSAPGVQVVAGGTTDDSVGWFVRPTVALSEDPTDELFTTEYFGPILGVHVFEDADYDSILSLADTSSPYGLTGSVFARDRRVIEASSDALRFAAGNFYVNDKSTGAVVGQQPFGGGRASGTNDKAGAPHNLLRWTSPRSIKETLAAPTVSAYPHQAAE
ncbi:L-glutamate gamma-semialdehyde dehydrogenase [Microbacterium sp.]|uniref:L-glutamate gamma-semialdehyde dehydrogenase n=1 Tax=Microbacterium sp. TaxID=51671 RepID=UPI003C796A25